MTDMLVSPENETFPNRRRWTVEQCYHLIETGDLVGRWELIDGEVLSKMGQGQSHSYTLVLVAEWLAGLFGFRRTRTQLPIRIDGEAGAFSEPEPDIAVITEQAAMRHDRGPGSAEVLLIVEIADTSLQFDLSTKALLYARCGVPEYWVVDVAGRKLHRHRKPGYTGYMLTDVLSDGELISPEAGATNTVTIDELLPPRTE